jgi:hypothetical protein
VCVDWKLSWVEDGELDPEPFKGSRLNSSLKILGFEGRRAPDRRGERFELDESGERRCSRRLSAIFDCDLPTALKGVGLDV